MQLTTILLSAAAALPLISAMPAGGPSNPNFARVDNNCPFTAYVQSVPNGGGAPSQVLALGPKMSGYYSESQKASGGKLNVGKDKALRTPLSMGYTPSNGQVWYDLSNQWGNDFAGYRNTVTPGASTCAKFNCAAGDEACYSNGNHLHIQVCKQTSLTMKLCA